MADSIEVGKHIGANDIVGARRAAACVMALGVGLAAVWSVCLATFAVPISAFFTASARVNELTAMPQRLESGSGSERGGSHIDLWIRSPIRMCQARLLPVVGLVGFLDAMSNTLGGVCSGLGLQRIAATAQLVGYYAIGTPTGVALAFGACVP